MTNQKTADFIRAKIQELDHQLAAFDSLVEERDEWKAMLRRYDAQDTPAVPVHESETIVPLDAPSKPITALIVDAVRERPGINFEQLYASVSVHLTTEAKNPRKNLSSTASNMVGSKRLLKRGDRFYPVQG